MADAVSTGARTRSMDRLSLGRLLRAREAGVFIALAVLCLFLTFATDGFLTSTNLLNVGRQISLLGVMAVGMTFVLIAGEVDLSVGSIYAFSGLSTGMLIIAGWALLPAIAVGVLAGMIIGMINGLLSTYGRLPSLIATLGMLSIVRGAALILTNGQPVTVNLRNGAQPEVLSSFSYMGQGYLFGVVPMQLVFFVIIAACAWVILSCTNFGFRIFAVGGSAKAARVSGISVNTMKIWAFVLMGALAALAGILSLAFLPSGQAGRTGLGLELDVIAATIVGGASLSGGEGTILGTILGVLIIGVMRNGLVLMGVSPFVQELMIGLVIIIAVGIDKWSRRRTA
ncbi:MAG: ABC transporter permease [Alphaproteobacteria bacterium]|nr:ABC transporter permease [Alphaproteobacteria bacterium]MBU0803904.1 ABC transporter permease [Alphaproteobacteria bacterium]MBU0872799.1 ABC transporter permease [Alphaproteobacteria bacterium]MBU1402831.1 ABC transporter permease [Alphaproteobacteria bacterium]MBU1593473.1 ABC transporter permease [Alphaproteobacteria bacterium]